MVPKVAGKGRSFKGAGLYYLHDKKAMTAERVAFTHTENLPTSDPDKAIKCMAYTAMRQQERKMRTGGSAKGRKLEQPVYGYSLSWAPGEEPTKEQMIEAAKETLKELGLSGHEALFIGHSDEPHPHIHVIVNRVNPETGIAAKLPNDYLKLSKWAEAYERRQGLIRCEQRVENNELRRQGEFARDRTSKHAAEYHRWQQERVASAIDRRSLATAALDARHEREREQLRLVRDREVEDQRVRLQEANRPAWRDLYAIQKQERERLAASQRDAFGRLRFFAKAHGQDYARLGKGGRMEIVKGAFAALIGAKSQIERLESKHKAERSFFSGALDSKAERLIERIDARFKPLLAKMKERQAKEGQALRHEQSKESQEAAKGIASGSDREAFEKYLKSKTLTGRFTAAQQETATDKQRAKPGLAEQFARAKGEHGKEKPASRSTQFKDNARDAGHDVGRERTRKPPKK